MSKKLSNEDCLKLYNRIIKLVKKSDFNFFKLKKLRGAMGYCEWEKGIILDYRRELVPTLIHECIHYLEPEWSESKVLYSEKRVVNVIDSKQITKLLKLFIQCLP